MATEPASFVAGAGPVVPEPREWLDPRARTLWRLTAVFEGATIVAVALVLAAGLWWLDRHPALVALPVLAATIFAVVDVIVVPELRWRHWRYEIGSDEVQIQYGWFTVTRTVIPITRIQHVDTRRGPLQRRFGLTTLVLFTAAGASEIPALADPAADAVRDRIAALANIRDDL